ncbi:MAG: hypothetical protein HQM09_07665 [Candidatus Riflebacteria bacterium]|nr:hypothetical protein [Candidatus Riflebacteria bacterium]
MNRGRFEQLPSPDKGLLDPGRNHIGTNRHEPGKTGACLVSLYLVVALIWFSLMGLVLLTDFLEIHEISFSIRVTNSTNRPLDIYDFTPRDGGGYDLNTSLFFKAPNRQVASGAIVTWQCEGLGKAEHRFLAICPQQISSSATGLADVAFKKGSYATGTIDVVFSPEDFSSQALPPDLKTSSAFGFLLFIEIGFLVSEALPVLENLLERLTRAKSSLSSSGKR